MKKSERISEIEIYWNTVSDRPPTKIRGSLREVGELFLVFSEDGKEVYWINKSCVAMVVIRRGK